MPIFAAIKVHYDHRKVLRAHLKYSQVPSRQEYDAYLKLFRVDNIGGNGFHECMNFAAGHDDRVRFYLPPTCMPTKKLQDEEFVFFSFTYKGDREMSAHVVGVHAGARLVDRVGLVRGAPYEIDGVEPLMFHVQAPSDLVTLTVPALPYDAVEGRYTPPYTPPRSKWGYGLRYIDASHAANILRDATAQATLALASASASERVVLEHQIDFLHRIGTRYGISVDGPRARRVASAAPPNGSLPDTEIGYMGERLVYERERACVTGKLKRTDSDVEWTSQAVPTSPFDIRTLRETKDGVREHFLEVKSSALGEGENVYVSAQQLDFFKAHRDQASFMFVNFGTGTPTLRELTLDEVLDTYELAPVKYKLARRGC